MKLKEGEMTRKHSLGAKPVQELIAQILKFPTNPESVKELMRKGLLLEEDLNKSETYDERVGIRKELRKVREDLKSKMRI